jgi:predicted CoA-binding protein
VADNPPDRTLQEVLSRARTIAVVGLSDRPDRPSHDVAAYLQRAGYRIVPVNPRLAGREVLGERVAASLREIPVRVDVVDVFRRPEFVPEVVEDCLAYGVPVIWLQLGIAHPEAAARARAAGVLIVQDRCLKVEHARLCR